MLLVAPVAEQQRLAGGPGGTPPDSTSSNIVRSRIPAVTHVDYSARVQTVDARANPRLHRLMKAFDEKTGCPVLINTSFNVRGEPIVCTPEHAYHCFMGTDMDVLVLESFVLLKSEQAEDGVDRDGYLARFELD